MLDQGNRREAAEGPGGGSLPMQEMEGVRDQNITWKLQGEKLRGKDGVGSLPLQAPLPLPTAAPQLCDGSFPQIRTRGGRVSLRLVITEVAASTQARGLTSPRALTAGIRLRLCLSVILRESASWSVKMLHKKSLLGR